MLRTLEVAPLHAMNAYVARIHIALLFLTSLLERDECSCHGHFSTRERIQERTEEEAGWQSNRSCVRHQNTMQKLISCVITNKEGSLTSIKRQKSFVRVTFQYLQPRTY